MDNTTNPVPPTLPAKNTSPFVKVLIGCGVFLVVCGIAASVFLWWGYHKAKNYVESQTDLGSTKVAELWPDVPRMDGMTSSQQIDMPLTLKVIARPIMDTMMRGVNDGKNAGKWDWTAFSIPGKTASDVQSFYTPEKMEANGWKQEGGCVPVSAMGEGQPTICSFQKQEGDKTTGLLIISANDEEHKANSVFFIRQESQGSDSTPNP